MKKIYSLALFFLFTHFFICQQIVPPTLLWQKVMLTGNNDRVVDIVETSDSGYIVIGSTDTSPGALPDCRVTRFDSNGNIVWDKTFGGTGREFCGKIIKTNDGNYLIMGSSTSTNGTVGPHPDTNLIWVYKIDGAGNLLWTKNYNGKYATKALLVSDGYVLVGIATVSNSSDVRVFKISFDGTLIWTKSYGGSGDDEGVSIVPTPDNGYMVYGQTYSNNGIISGNHGQLDGWIIKLDAAGNLLWNKTMGGSGFEYAIDSLRLDDGYVFWGTTSSMDGDLAGTAVDNDADFWIFKTDFNGNIIWQKKIGSNYYENYSFGGIRKTSDNNLLVVGTVSNGNKTVYESGYHGASDIWFLKFDQSGNMLWKKCYGGGSYDTSGGFIEDSNGNIVFVGGTNSVDGDLAGSGKTTANEDSWTVKLNLETYLSTRDKDLGNAAIRIYPNPAKDHIAIISPAQVLEIKVLTSAGQFLFKTDQSDIDISHLKKGVYYLQIQTNSGIIHGKFLKD
ncbi:MAG: T9SS type A sorting domain-containing protein [Chryseobacterium sp.]|uniref:T9SS type A sorting domain-containing protein n=1 Tax=Chryseobacterium sp. TaxID=1871047 RepID=UPI0025BD035B|nr:T9SS type A sorting domain-containing protein [Chryseobacterium sp.]MCJ7934651.1 T9SS type A sorting domain-containing protein [Chryseobacterium sp.]